MHAVRFHYTAARYLLTRYAGKHLPAIAFGPAGCVKLDDIEPPRLPGPDWVRVRTTLSGICGSDLSAVTAHDSFTLEPFAAFPFTFGHENVGVIEEAGGEAGSWQAGERVVVNPMLSCAQRGLSPACAACARGDYGLCRRTTDGALGGGPMIGFCPAVGGGWAAEFVAHRTQLRSAAELPDEVAVLTDPFGSALRGVLLNPPLADDAVLVIGAGTIGALTVKALRLTGFQGDIAVLGRYAFQLELAERAGASRVFRTRGEAYRWAESLPGARSYKPTLAHRFVEGGPSLIYDTVGSEQSLGDSFALAREAGRVVLTGGAARLSADMTRLWYRQLSVSGVFAYGQVPFRGRTSDIFDAALELMRADGFGELNMVTHVYPVEEYRAAIAAALDKNGHRSIKVVFRP